MRYHEEYVENTVETVLDHWNQCKGEAKITARVRLHRYQWLMLIKRCIKDIIWYGLEVQLERVGPSWRSSQASRGWKKFGLGLSSTRVATRHLQLEPNPRLFDGFRCNLRWVRIVFRWDWFSFDSSWVRIDDRKSVCPG